jgi:hypothetical protein
MHFPKIVMLEFLLFAMGSSLNTAHADITFEVLLQMLDEWEHLFER